MSTFPWDGVRLRYFDHPYNDTALNMRRIEIPIVRHHMRKMLRGRGPIRVLEVGNVLSNYQDIAWPVIDLHEDGCINEDITTYRPPEPVDLIVSISTVEHVCGDPNAVLANIRSCLAPGGLAVITIPPRYNKHIRRYLQKGILAYDRISAMRHAGQNQWTPCTIREAIAQPANSCSGRWHGGMACIYLDARR